MLTRPTTVLTYAGARFALDAALARAELIGGAFNIAVTDPAGQLLAFARMDGAFAHSGAIARDKAATVAGFGGLSSEALYAAVSEEPDVLTGIVTRPGIAAFPGGVPVRLGDEVVGAIGVSGGSAAQDKAVAIAGATALAEAATARSGTR